MLQQFLTTRVFSTWTPRPSQRPTFEVGCHDHPPTTPPSSPGHEELLGAMAAMSKKWGKLGKNPSIYIYILIYIYIIIYIYNYIYI